MTTCAAPLILLSMLAVACSADEKPSTAAAISMAQHQKAIDQLLIPFSSPVLLDRSDYVMYPLALSEILKEEESEYGSSYSRTESFWNIAFYNAKTGAVSLLDERRKMLIQAYKTTSYNNSEGNSNGNAAAAYAPFFAGDKLLYFSVITTDFDHDGLLTERDPTYLFTSDKSGANFTQVSPDSMHVAGWEIQKTTGKLVMQLHQDSNHDRRFGEEDAIIPYAYDLVTRQPAAPIFSPPFTKNLRTVFRRHWAKQAAAPSAK